MANILKSLWAELDPVIELAIYLGIAYGITKVFGTTYLQSVAIVFIYFILNLLRVAIEVIRDKVR